MTILHAHARLTLLSWSLLALLPTLARAHPLSPPALSIREQAPAHYDVTFRRSTLAATRLTLDWPSRCQPTLRASRTEGDQVIDELSLVCAGSLEGQTLRVFGLLELELSMLVHLELAGSSGVRALLSPEHPSLLIPRASSALEVLRDYTGLGIQHLLGGADHALFILGLLLLVRGLRARLLALTAFTLGHSVTLCLAALSVIRVPQAPVELGIAVSLLVLALEALAPPRIGQSDRQGMRRAALLAGGFGLLHGLGFASALSETGLPAHAVPLSLFGFNLGVELGQLLLVSLLAPCLYWAGRFDAGYSQVRARERKGTAPRLQRVVAYGIGACAAMWCIERAVWLL